MRPLANLCCIAAATASLYAQTVDEIVAHALAARGGVQKIKAIQSQRLSGTIAFGTEPAEPFRVEMKRPHKMRQEIGVNGKFIIQILNEDHGWSFNPLKVPSTVTPLPAEQVHNMKGGGDIDGPLMDYKSKGTRIEFGGKVKVDGSDAYKLIITLQDGEVRHDYVDCASYREVKWEGKVGADGKALVESYFRDYRPVNGVLFSFAIDSGTPGAATNQKLRFEKVEVNPAIPDSDFQKTSLPVVH